VTSILSRGKEDTVQRLLLIVLLFSTGAVSQTPDPTPVDARISGTVVNEDGKPVPQAAVYVSQEASSLVDAQSIVTRTDAAGRFDFGRSLKHGFYEIYARKDEDGYPDPTSKFYQPLNFTLQNVQLFGDRPAKQVTVHLEGKGALLAGRVFDSDTGRPLKASIGLYNLQTNAGRGVVASGNFSELIPANADVTVMVQTVDPDHDDWSVFTTKVNLQPGQKMEIEVPLYKTPTPPDGSE
jgi:hypothetical protein